MEANDAILLLNKFDRMLDCTYPPEDLADAIGFDRRLDISVSVSIVAGGVDDEFEFCFSIRSGYDEAKEKYMDPDSDIIVKYFNEMKKEDE